MTQNGQFKKECEELEKINLYLLNKRKEFLALCEACHKLNKEIHEMRKDGQNESIS